MQNVKKKIYEAIDICSSIGCYGVKPDSVGDSWMCSRCAQGAWTVVSSSITLKESQVLFSPGLVLDKRLKIYVKIFLRVNWIWRFYMSSFRVKSALVKIRKIFVEGMRAQNTCHCLLHFSGVLSL